MAATMAVRKAVPMVEMLTVPKDERLVGKMAAWTAATTGDLMFAQLASIVVERWVDPVVGGMAVTTVVVMADQKESIEVEWMAGVKAVLWALNKAVEMAGMMVC